MTASVYVIGGAGTGKSTFTQQLLDDLGPLGEVEELHAAPNRKNIVTLRGHRIGVDGVYLGLMRESFPGTDGLDRASSPVGAEWLGQGRLPDFILSEGSTLATRPFMRALHEHTDLLVIHLVADDFVKDLRFIQRGSNQDEKFVLATATRSANLAADLQKEGARVIEVDSADPSAWEIALIAALEKLSSASR